MSAHSLLHVLPASSDLVGTCSGRTRGGGESPRGIPGARQSPPSPTVLSPCASPASLAPRGSRCSCGSATSSLVPYAAQDFKCLWNVLGKRVIHVKSDGANSLHVQRPAPSSVAGDRTRA
eukprot:761792-Hanusia_phi.AAC.1